MRKSRQLAKYHYKILIEQLVPRQNNYLQKKGALLISSQLFGIA